MPFARPPFGLTFRVLSRPALILALAAGLIVCVAACMGPRRVDAPVIAFPDGVLISLDAERPPVVVERYRAPLSPPNVEHEYALVPAQIANAWVRDRVALSGTGGAVKVTIHDASVVEERLPVRAGVFQWLRNDVNRRFTGRLDVQIDFVGVAGRAASARAEVTVTRAVRENADASDLDAIYFGMMQDMARGFDAEMTRQIEQTFLRARSGAA